jgi:hypothetical protein
MVTSPVPESIPVDDKVIPNPAITFVIIARPVVTGDVTINSASGIFGSDYHEAESNAPVNTTSATLATKTTLTWTPPVAGTYIISWYFELANNTAEAYSGAGHAGGTTNYSVNNGATVLSSSSIVVVLAEASNGWIPIQGFISQALTNVSTTFTIQYAAGSNTAYIQNARLVAYRVS